MGPFTTTRLGLITRCPKPSTYTWRIPFIYELLSSIRAVFEFIPFPLPSPSSNLVRTCEQFGVVKRWTLSSAASWLIDELKRLECDAEGGLVRGHKTYIRSIPYQGYPLYLGTNYLVDCAAIVFVCAYVEILQLFYLLLHSTNSVKTSKGNSLARILSLYSNSNTSVCIYMRRL